MSNVDENVFIGVMDLQEAKTHQIKLKDKGIEVNFKTNGETCTTGCKVTVEVWGNEKDLITLQSYFRDQFLRNVQGHVPNFDHLAQVYDPGASEVICQACGMRFSPAAKECPDCGLVYS